jgi:hypothetical protein
MAMRVLDGKLDRFLSAALASASRAPPRSRRNSYFSADASGSSCPQAGSSDDGDLKDKGRGEPIVFKAAAQSLLGVQTFGVAVPASPGAGW